MLPRERQTVAPPHGVWLLRICATSGAMSRLLNIRSTCICFLQRLTFSCLVIDWAYLDEDSYLTIDRSVCSRHTTANVRCHVSLNCCGVLIKTTRFLADTHYIVVNRYYCTTIDDEFVMYEGQSETRKTCIRMLRSDDVEQAYMLETEGTHYYTIHLLFTLLIINLPSASNDYHCLEARAAWNSPVPNRRIAFSLSTQLTSQDSRCSRIRRP